MLNGIKHLWLAIVLIAAATAILLFSDTQRREGSSSKIGATSLPRIAILQFASTPLLDAHVAGVKDGLRKHGFLAADEHNLRLFNPQADFPTANAVAREMTQGDYDLLITSSTSALQILAKANLNTRLKHVFGAVTYPQGAGVGITGTETNQHPAWLTGIGTFQPVEQAFEVARQLNPQLQCVGVVRNPGEQCSEACMVIARATCERLGIRLEEAIAAQSAEVNEAVRSLLSKHVEAIWIGGDTVATAGSEMIIHLAAKEQVPVFTNDPTDTGKGALFGLGADYRTVGLYTADMAADVLNGRPPSSFRIENIIPEKFILNESTLASLSSRWTLVDSVKKRITD